MTSAIVPKEISVFKTFDLSYFTTKQSGLIESVGRKMNIIRKV